MSTQPRIRLTAEEYLERERKADTKSEYLDGEIYAMSGATRRHNLIAGNIHTDLNNQLRDRDCEVYGSDMRVKVTATSLYAYPDVSAVCGEPSFENDTEDVLLNPNLLIEVLSDSTEAYDRGEKSKHYRQIESLAEYLLVSQKKMHLEIYCRLHTSHAFHSSMMDPALEPFGRELEKVQLQPPRIPYLSNLTGGWITASQATDPGYWTKHLRQSVRFSQGLCELLQDPQRILLEVGPGTTLSSLSANRRLKGASGPSFRPWSGLPSPSPASPLSPWRPTACCCWPPCRPSDPAETPGTSCCPSGARRQNAPHSWTYSRCCAWK